MAVELRLKVQVWIYSEQAGALRVLLLLMRPARGGYWQPVTGSVEQGEDLTAAALREAQEETGLLFKVAPESLKREFEFESRGMRFREFGFALMAPGSSDTLKIKLDPREHVDYRWVSPEEALEMLQYPSNADMLRELILRNQKKE